MTQKELDALMGYDASDEDSQADTSAGDTSKSPSNEISSDFKINSDANWPPPPPTADHKMVQQLDDVTKDSEEKATQVLDMIDALNAILTDSEAQANEVKELLNKNLDIFSKLMDKFPHISTFVTLKDENQNAVNKVDEIIKKLQNGQDDCMSVMDVMQYQDIHRQKIERVINVMRALIKYMNSLFESDVDDKKRPPSAVYLDGDKTDNLMSDEDIEALINSFAKK